jgi:L-amino acid N-acyltransferase YncA
MNPQDSLHGKAYRTRSAEFEDAVQIAQIYGYHVAEGAGTFEEVAPTADEIRRRMENVKARGLPWQVAEIAGRLVGYCYASPYHPRSAYKFTAQTSVYVDRSWQRRGIGLTLLQAVLALCDELGYCQVMAAVGDSRNESALRLHARAGYRTVGHALRVGVKFGRWVDVVYMQRSLGDPTDPPPRAGPRGYLPPSDQTGP